MMQRPVPVATIKPLHMKPPKKNAITQYLKDNLGHYTNPFGVHADLTEDGFFNIGAKWPDIYVGPDYNLEICIEDITVEEFSKLTSITSVEQLHFVSPHTLIELYHQGVSFVSVIYENDDLYYELVFRKKGDKLYMIDEEEDKERVVRKKLEKPGDFISYITNYVSKL